MAEPYEVRLDEHGVLDEVVAEVGHAVIHLEQMGPATWWLRAQDDLRPEGSVVLRFEAHWLVVERDGPGHVPIRSVTSAGERLTRYGSSERRWEATWGDWLQERLADLEETPLRPLASLLLRWVEVLRG